MMGIVDEFREEGLRISDLIQKLPEGMGILQKNCEKYNIPTAEYKCLIIVKLR